MNGIWIRSNGTPQGTHVYNARTGDEIKDIVELTLIAKHDGVFAKMTVKVSSVDAIVDEENVETKENGK